MTTDDDPVADDDLRPGDEAPVDEPSSGENLCPECDGTGKLDGDTCPNCLGTGKVNEAIGGG
jgi:RecJ-like exonuclease